MTTTTQYESIIHTILDGNLCVDGTPTRAAVDRLASLTAAALAEAFPGAAVEVPVMRKTSGSGPGDAFSPDASAFDEDLARQVEDASYQAWLESLTDADLEVRCECDEWSDERCEVVGPAAEMVTIEWMPEHLRASHEAAGNRGHFPVNGASRIRVSRACADRMLAQDGEWCEEVER